MDGSGLTEVWVESGLLGQDTVELVRSGKAYNKGMRAHTHLASPVVTFGENLSFVCCRRR